MNSKFSKRYEDFLESLTESAHKQFTTSHYYEAAINAITDLDAACRDAMQDIDHAVLDDLKAALLQLSEQEAAFFYRQGMRDTVSLLRQLYLSA